MSQPAPLPWPPLSAAPIRPEPAGPVAAGPTEVSEQQAAAARGEKRRRAIEQRRRSFLRMVSHELRTPLNTVIGFSEIIACELYGPLGAPQYKEYAELVRQSGHRLLKLVNQVIEIARLEDGVVDLDLRPESIEHAIDDVLGSLKDDIATRAVRIVVEGRTTLPVAFADGRGLRTILMNLLQNAIAHSPPGSTIAIRCRRSGAPETLVDIEIEDNGPGVETGLLPRMLQPFEQGGEALTRSTEGAGLGLPITRLLARAMHGQLRLRSAPGEGFTAIVTLPAA
jgi:signal transduction histidine kinase